MYELLFYVGIVLCITCFILSIFFFFSQNVIGAIKYFLKLDTKMMKKEKNNSNNIPIVVQNSVTAANQNNVLNSNLLNNSTQRANYKTNNGLIRNMNETTEILNNSNLNPNFEPTEILNFSNAKSTNVSVINADEKTELLGVANFATALLDADSTTVLPNIEDEV